QRRRDFRLNLFRDADELAGLIFKAERTGALMIGGGISKHHTHTFIFFFRINYGHSIHSLVLSSVNSPFGAFFRLIMSLL
ncbi:MAG: deoxyhypusine synthase family protein, partial [Nitrososphaerota archaeon]